MRGLLRTRWGVLVHSLWFFPGLIVAGFIVLALGLIELDRHVEAESRFVFGGQSDAGRELLAVLAGSLITIAGVTFSVTVVVLQLVSSQFSPRVLRTFLGDPLTQATAGIFIGVFLYCLLVLESVRDATRETAPFLPALAITFAIVLGIVALAFLLAFIHHMAQSIQASNLTHAIGLETEEALEEIHRVALGDRPEEDANALLEGWEAGGEPRRIPAGRAGFVQSIAPKELGTELRVEGSKIHICVRPGDFVTPETTLARVWSEDSDERLHKAFRHAINVAAERDIDQDAAFGFRQLADIAIKALSPSINDPTTATTAIGYMRAAALCLARRAAPARVLIPDDKAEIVADTRTFDEYVDLFVDVGRHAASEPRVASALLDALRDIASAMPVGAVARRRVLSGAAAAIAEPALAAASTTHDREQLATFHERAQAAARSDGDQESRIDDHAEQADAEAARALLR